MELRLLRAFIRIAEEGSITAASRRLFTTQPAVTRQLAQLERSLGARLFDRTPHGVVLTDAGGRLLPEARRLVELADAVAEQDLDERRCEEVRLTCGWWRRIDSRATSSLS